MIKFISVLTLIFVSPHAFASKTVASDPIMSSPLIHCDFDTVEDGVKKIKFAEVSSDDTGKSDLAVLVSGYNDDPRGTMEVDIGHLSGGGMPATFTSKNLTLSRRLDIKAQDANFTSDGIEPWGNHSPWHQEFTHGKCTREYQESIGAHNK